VVHSGLNTSKTYYAKVNRILLLKGRTIKQQGITKNIPLQDYQVVNSNIAREASHRTNRSKADAIGNKAHNQA